VVQVIVSKDSIAEALG